MTLPVSLEDIRDQSISTEFTSPVSEEEMQQAVRTLLLGFSWLERTVVWRPGGGLLQNDIETDDDEEPCEEKAAVTTILKQQKQVKPRRRRRWL